MIKKVIYIILLFASVLFAFTIEEKLAKEQNFIYNAGAAPQSLDPAKVEGVPEGVFARSLFETLVISDENDKLIPGVALTWNHSDDYKTWTFNLRKDAKWSNGDNVTAKDFVFAWRRLVDPKTASPYASFLTYMKLLNASAILNGQMSPEALGVEAKDDYTLVLHLEDFVPFADLLTEFYVLSPVPQKLVEKLGDAWSEPKNIVGNGAFKLDSLVLNEEAKLSKNPYYWDVKKVLLDKLTLLQIQNSSVAYTRYRSGKLDVGEFPLELLDSVHKDYAQELNIGPVLCTYFYEFNVKNPPFDNIKVRQALSMALDRNIITDKILRQGQIPAFVFSPPAINAAEFISLPQWSKWDDNKRHKEAIKLLNEAGYNKDNPLNFTLLYNTNEDHKKLAIAASSIWKQNLGSIINIKLQNQEWKTFLSTRHLGQHQMARAGWCSDYDEASSFLNTFLSDSSNNTSGFKNVQYDKAIKQAYKAKTEEQRARFYAQAEEILDQEVPLIPVYFYTKSQLVKPYVKGFKIKPSQNYYFKDVYILEH
ncbi:oligopeptide ABC transporter substrate-binding protein OppA [Campylobacter hepaticus]|uniref:ABC transporter substrate-binding protein n=1 Tax=Campylobacter hepaticus TaxID=1813019 RepID=UPI0018CB816F|nr:ABC transporter substrate-binding protein [Campylobacter hepaticus]QPM43986.1 oligopeptide ABC transporter substrate-binding protein OppA [Campylobacter hepaticus]